MTLKLSKIQEAIQYLESEVDLPAINHPLLDEDVKDQVRKSQRSINTMKTVGDLYKYLKRFTIVGGQPENLKVHGKLKAMGLTTYEDLLPRFVQRFEEHLYDCTKIEDFNVGETYTSYDMVNYVGKYNIQSGIIPVGDEPNYSAVFIKGTIGGDRYSNQWLVPDLEIKYYFYKIGEHYSEEHKYNRAILNTQDVPIYVFIKNTSGYELKGIFNLVKAVTESDGKKWFHLRKVDSVPSQVAILEKEYLVDQEARIKSVHKLSENELVEKLQASPPEKIEKVISYKKKRNIYVTEFTLRRANGVCECCKKPAPFNRASDNTPYLEVHHKIQLADGGPDTITNTIAVCPNCHRKAHFG